MGCITGCVAGASVGCWNMERRGPCVCGGVGAGLRAFDNTRVAGLLGCWTGGAGLLWSLSSRTRADFLVSSLEGELGRLRTRMSGVGERRARVEVGQVMADMMGMVDRCERDEALIWCIGRRWLTV